ncbi:hypothetical protein RJ641_035982 [Dillenia turbinata]|uniref:Uncharacterized protein n=1 Tax=Dillenia turbinata TaxID=194707 RepID=A0AAN8VSD3_9MAGN
MDSSKQVGSSSSITHDLFGPKDSSSSSTTSIFASKVLGKDSSGKHDSRIITENSKYATPDTHPQSIKGENANLASKEKSYQNDTSEPCYLSSSIYYGGQEVYSPNSRKAESHPNFKKDGGDDDSASRGNWWQGSLYY